MRNYPGAHQPPPHSPDFGAVDKQRGFREFWPMKSPNSPVESSPAQTSSRWHAVDFMVDFNSREKRLGLLMETFGWIITVAFFRRAESETHYLAEATELDQRYHQSILAALIAEGERMLTRMLLAGGLPQNADGIKTADIDATLEELRNTHAQWYGDMTAERRAQILKEVFDVPAS